ncbi:transcription factor SOX-2 isoform X2 [Passer domesticus]|uniref:transcription factor SOX-2 isoform X2 n=1 Tax=Passer domesticus TaxID=48849 RepID=UPI0030FE7967
MRQQRCQGLPAPGGAARCATLCPGLPLPLSPLPGPADPKPAPPPWQQQRAFPGGGAGAPRQKLSGLWRRGAHPGARPLCRPAPAAFPRRWRRPAWRGPVGERVPSPSSPPPLRGPFQERSWQTFALSRLVCLTTLLFPADIAWRGEHGAHWMLPVGVREQRGRSRDRGWPELSRPAAAACQGLTVPAPGLCAETARLPPNAFKRRASPAAPGPAGRAVPCRAVPGRAGPCRAGGGPGGRHSPAMSSFPCLRLPQL